MRRFLKPTAINGMKAVQLVQLDVKSSEVQLAIKEVDFGSTTNKMVSFKELLGICRVGKGAGHLSLLNNGNTKLKKSKTFHA